MGELDSLYCIFLITTNRNLSLKPLSYEKKTEIKKSTNL